MIVVKWGLFFLALLSNLPWEEEMEQLDQQIKQLQDVQEKLKSNIQRNANNAMRWQFQNENYLDARRAWDRVAADKQKVKELEEQIKDLEEKKAKILEQHEHTTAS